MSAVVGIRELRQNVSALLRRVQAGESFEVTDRGHPVARIVPLRAGPLEQMVSEGRVTPGGDLLETLRRLGLPAAGANPTSGALAELRDDER